MPLTEEKLLSKPLMELDFGPFTHPFAVTWARNWQRKMITHLDVSIKSFEDRRILVISWILAVMPYMLAVDWMPDNQNSVLARA